MYHRFSNFGFLVGKTDFQKQQITADHAIDKHWDISKTAKSSFGGMKSVSKREV
jgi:hypothetical protein